MLRIQNKSNKQSKRTLSYYVKYGGKRLSYWRPRREHLGAECVEWGAQIDVFCQASPPNTFDTIARVCLFFIKHDSPTLFKPIL